VYNIRYLHEYRTVGSLKIWSFCPFPRLNSPKNKVKGSRDKDKGKGKKIS
jgi:hypothetical protein